LGRLVYPRIFFDKSDFLGCFCRKRPEILNIVNNTKAEDILFYQKRKTWIYAFVFDDFSFPNAVAKFGDRVGCPRDQINDRPFAITFPYS